MKSGTKVNLQRRCRNCQKAGISKEPGPRLKKSVARTKFGAAALVQEQSKSGAKSMVSFGTWLQEQSSQQMKRRCAKYCENVCLSKETGPRHQKHIALAKFGTAARV